MRIFREIATWTALAVLVAITTGAAVRVVSRGLPDTELLKQSEIRQWLLARDVTNVAPSKRRELAQQLEIEFLRGRGWPIDYELLDEDRRKRLESNAASLMQAWLMEKVETWESLPTDQRETYAAEQVDRILRWRVLLSDQEHGLHALPLQEAMTARSKQMAREFWFQHFTPDEQRRLWAFLMAVINAAPERAMKNVQSRWPGTN